jgi:hypothetical protein
MRGTGDVPSYACVVPVVVSLLAVLLVVVLLVLFLPLSFALRYRAGTARRLARGWVATANAAAIGISLVLLLASAAMADLWVPGALRATLAGLAAGATLGLLGLALSRWEATHQSLHFTPNRWLVLAVMLVVAARIAYGFWRAWTAWGATPDESSWLADAGLAGTMGAGALVVGYYLVFWLGVRQRFRRHRRTLPLA